MDLVFEGFLMDVNGKLELLWGIFRDFDHAFVWLLMNAATTSQGQTEPNELIKLPFGLALHNVYKRMHTSDQTAN